MDFQEQARSHAEIRETLQAAISLERPVDVAAFKSDRVCATGCWLHGEGRRRWAGSHAFLGLFEAHRDFHAAAGKIAEQINARQYAEARRGLRTDAPLALALADLNAAFRRMRAAWDSLVA